MAWSTRELARIAGTTENSVRYYHRVGLLPHPERAANGYKRYEVAQLVSHSAPLETPAGLVLAHALVDLYNPAQQKVLQRLDALMAREE